MRTVPKASSVLLLAGLLLASSACVYRMPIQQGNFLDKKQVDQLEPGMTRSQVAFLLGTPMVPNGFRQGSLGLLLLRPIQPEVQAGYLPRDGVLQGRKGRPRRQAAGAGKAARRLPKEALDVPKGPPVDTGANPAALPNALIPETPVAPDTPEGQRTKPLPGQVTHVRTLGPGYEGIHQRIDGLLYQRRQRQTRQAALGLEIQRQGHTTTDHVLSLPGLVTGDSVHSPCRLRNGPSTSSMRTCRSGVRWLRVVNAVRSGPRPTVRRAWISESRSRQHLRRRATGNKLGITLDFVDELEHPLRRRRHQRRTPDLSHEEIVASRYNAAWQMTTGTGQGADCGKPQGAA